VAEQFQPKSLDLEPQAPVHVSDDEADVFEGHRFQHFDPPQDISSSA
jgi:hypothetical protein